MCYNKLRGSLWKREMPFSGISRVLVLLKECGG